MGIKYPDNKIVGYNTSPPSDDGSKILSNAISWAIHILKIGDPLKTLIEKINADLLVVFDRGPTTGFSGLIADYAKVLQASGGNITLQRTNTLYSGYYVTFKNTGATDHLINIQTGDTVEGTTSVPFSAGEAVTLMVDASAANWIVTSRTSLKIRFSSVRLSAAQTISGNIKVAYDTLVNDDSGDFDIVTNNRFNVPADGLYRIVVTAKWLLLVSGDEIHLDLRKNATPEYLSRSVKFSAGTQDAHVITWVGQLLSTDYIEVFAENVIRNTSTLDGGGFDITTFSVERL